jgi:hypothetical protein
MTASERRKVRVRLTAIPDDEERLGLAMGWYIGEVSTMLPRHAFPGSPVSWRGTLIQYAGRLHRLHPRKEEARIFDYVDRGVPMLARMSEKRLRGYRAIGYARGQAPLGYAEAEDELMVEYDDDTLGSLDGSENFA